jgi:predicted Zn-dependent protease
MSAKARSIALILLLATICTSLIAQRRFRGPDFSPDTAAALMEEGEYRLCVETFEQAAQYGYDGEEWQIIALDCLHQIGRFEEAAKQAQTAVEAYPENFTILEKTERALRESGNTEAAADILKKLNDLATSTKRADLTAAQLTSLGKAALRLGAEPKLVLAAFFNAARKKDPKNLEAHLAAANLAIDKADYALAEKTLLEAQKELGERVGILHGLALSYFPSDREKSQSYIERLLAKNPHHIPSLLLNMEAAIDAEKYADALSIHELITTQINPNHPETWALLAAVHNIRDQSDKAKTARNKALQFWKTNPDVDYTIGRKIAQKRRFTEAADFQRAALKLAPDHREAKAELAQNLLRLGKEDEGWKLIDEVRQKDAYNVTAYNLTKLHDRLNTFTTLTRGQFRVRMTQKESVIYGQRVLDLLESAEKNLGEKYGFRVAQPVTVDFYPEQQDFAIRTLGMPGGLGLLGACFGYVITMNSPGSLAAGESNWESTLWHEFCHTITLGATRNRIPRWLTEGFSVYEESQRDPACGMRMNADYREMILNHERGPIPLRELSSALLAYNEPQLVSFAYFQAKLVIEHLVKTHGESAVKTILTDLSKGKLIEDILAKLAGTEDNFDKAMQAYVVSAAKAHAPKLDWTKPENPDPATAANHLKKHPNSLWALTAQTKSLIGEEKWTEALTPALELAKLYPDHTEADNPWYLLATIHRNLDNPEAERQALQTWTNASGEAPYAYRRLIDLQKESQLWPDLEKTAQKLLAINPLQRTPQSAYAYATAANNKPKESIAAFKNLLLLNPTNPSEIHYQLAKFTKDKKEVLKSLEESPRNQKAHQLLLELSQK